MVGWGRSRYAVTDLGEARPNWGPKGRKIFLRDRVPRLSQDLRISGSQDGRPPSLPPSLIWRAGSATGHVRLLLLWTIILKLGTSKNLHRYKRGNWLGKNSMYSIWIFGVYNVRVFNPNPSLKVEKLMHCKVVQPSSEKRNKLWNHSLSTIIRYRFASNMQRIILIDKYENRVCNKSKIHNSILCLYKGEEFWKKEEFRCSEIRRIPARAVIYSYGLILQEVVTCV